MDEEEIQLLAIISSMDRANEDMIKYRPEKITPVMLCFGERSDGKKAHMFKSIDESIGAQNIVNIALEAKAHGFIPHIIALQAEGWMLAVEDEDDVKTYLDNQSDIVKDPRTIEVVCFIAMTRNTSVCIAREINRGPNNRIIFGEAFRSEYSQTNGIEKFFEVYDNAP